MTVKKEHRDESIITVLILFCNISESISYMPDCACCDVKIILNRLKASENERPNSRKI